ncbi:MAG TPA: hypothetical protein VKC89_01050 [Patescibacteria group bacterium]|nr:hypothetical protein [Patescibacteria group bacterium]
MSLEGHPNIANKIIESEIAEDAIDFTLNAWIYLASKVLSAINPGQLFLKEAKPASQDQVSKPPKKT